MTPAEASALTAKLFAAFPFHRDNDELTAAVYVQMLAELPDPALGLEAVDTAIRRSSYLPSIAVLIEGYGEACEARRARAPRIEEAPMTAEERLEAGRRFRVLANEFLKPVDERDWSGVEERLE